MTKTDEMVKLQIRVPRSLHEQFVEYAVEEERSLNGQIIFAMKKWAEQQESANAGAEVAPNV